MPKYKDKACECCGKPMQHVYCSKRALATIVSVERAAKAAGMSYGQYVARYDPPKPRAKG